jgi:hypothetical protein
VSTFESAATAKVYADFGGTLGDGDPFLAIHAPESREWPTVPAAFDAHYTSTHVPLVEKLVRGLTPKRHILKDGQLALALFT